MALGVHNTLDELIEAQRVAQYERLTQSLTGRHILDDIGITYEAQHGVRRDIPRKIREHLSIPPIPRNMHPEFHQDRRNARARALHKRFRSARDVVYVDAAEYANGQSMSIVATSLEGDCRVSGTVKTWKAEVAEEAALALAIAPRKLTS